MELEVDLQLESREEMRVWMHLSLAPVDAQVTVDGVSVELLDPAGDALCPRVLVPVAGQLRGPLLTVVELRATSPIPEGSRVRALAWCGDRVVEHTCPADPFVRLRDYMAGSRIAPPESDDVVLAPLCEQEREGLLAKMPWLDAVRPPDVAGVIDLEEDRTAEDLESDLGIDAESAEWLKDLLEEPDP